MAPKKDKGKNNEEKTGAFNEVERTFLELQLADCNRKVARLRTAVDEYEVQKEELQKAYDKLDEDRADIIAYLKRMLSMKNEENSELKEKVRGLEEIRQIENERFNETTTRLEKNFVIMKDQLSSENKLLAGKLNTLEEFRAMRDDLMRKFEKQEQEFKDQEMKYKRVIYNAEKKFIISKDNLKKEMEARLLQLSQDFQDATELRVAASTHRVIRENIAVSNELDSILSTQATLAEQNARFKEIMKSAVASRELAEEERDKAIGKSVVQLKVIDQLTTVLDSVKKEKSLYERRSYDFEALQAKVQILTKDNNNLSQQVRILEQNLHTRLSDQNKAVVEVAKMSKDRDMLRKILKEAGIAIQAALKLDEWAKVDNKREVIDRHVLLSHLLEIVSQFREIEQAESIGTIGSFSKIYEEGDLGFVPKPTIKKSAQASIVAAALTLPAKVVSKSEISQKSESLSESSIPTSIQTIPSIHIIPPNTKKDDESVVKDSIESLMASTVSEGTVEVEESQCTEGDIEQQLAASKIEMQKSFMMDLVYSQISTKQSQFKIDMDREMAKLKSQKVLETVDDDVLKDIEEEVAVAVAEAGPEIDDEDNKSEALQDQRSSGQETVDDSSSPIIEEKSSEEQIHKEDSSLPSGEQEQEEAD